MGQQPGERWAGLVMPGMNAPSGAASAALAAAFRSALLNQGTVVFMIFVLLAIAWVACRERLLVTARARLSVRLASSRANRRAEPAARRVLRIGFGILWIFDGLLQAQPSMPADLPSRVLAQAAAGSPTWIRHTVDWAAAAWSAHPVEAAAGAVWIQVGIGVWLLSATSQRWSRAAGLISLGWALVIWIFGEAFGSMLAPGASWLLGAPGAALFYCAAGLLLALPTASWRDARLGRGVLRATGALMLAFAVLQAWPGRGFWQGKPPSRPGSLASEIEAMAADRQPAVLHRLVADAASLAASHGFAVNLTAVIVLAAIGSCLLTGRAIVVRLAAFAAIALCVADWVLVQDLGFLGGVSTDPNSMLPQALIVTAGLVAMAADSAAVVVNVPAACPARASTPPVGPAGSGPVSATILPAGPVPASPAAAGPVSASTLPAGNLPATTLADADPVAAQARQRRRLPGRVVRGAGIALGMASTSSVLTLWAGAMVLLGAVPMALATVQRDPAPVVASSVQKPQLLTAALNADSQASEDRTGADGAGLARSRAASAERVTSLAPAEVTMASPSSSSC